jgi:hypothetical protein
MKTASLTGSCLCGQIRYTAKVERTRFIEKPGMVFIPAGNGAIQM